MEFKNALDLLDGKKQHFEKLFGDAVEKRNIQARALKEAEDRVTMYTNELDTLYKEINALKFYCG